MLNVLYVFDDNYAPHAGISILSLLENTPFAELHVFCAGMNVSDGNVRKIENLVNGYGKMLTWIDTASSIKCIESCDTGYWNGSKATWLKVFVLWELPEDVKSILYIDSDTIVSGDISDILTINLNGHPTAQAYDSLGNTYGRKVLGLERYYNAGVILFNVDYWKKDGFRNKFLEHLSLNVSKYRDNEQGLLNDYFRDEIVTLPLKYNTQGFLELFKEDIYLAVYDDFPFYTAEEIATARKNPSINHFFRIFGDYPWEKGNKHPLTPLYESYKEKSAWKNVVEKKIKGGFVFSVEKILYKVMPPKSYLKLYRWIVERKM